jgi:hypothetical protein
MHAACANRSLHNLTRAVARLDKWRLAGDVCAGLAHVAQDCRQRRGTGQFTIVVYSAFALQNPIEHRVMHGLWQLAGLQVRGKVPPLKERHRRPCSRAFDLPHEEPHRPLLGGGEARHRMHPGDATRHRVQRPVCSAVNVRVADGDKVDVEVQSSLAYRLDAGAGTLERLVRDIDAVVSAPTWNALRLDARANAADLGGVTVEWQHLFCGLEAGFPFRRSDSMRVLFCCGTSSCLRG